MIATVPVWGLLKIENSFWDTFIRVRPRVGITDIEITCTLNGESSPSPHGDYQNSVRACGNSFVASVPVWGLHEFRKETDLSRIASVPVWGLIKRRINNDKKN